jgi:hypothetical protein
VFGTVDGIVGPDPLARRPLSVNDERVFGQFETIVGRRNRRFGRVIIRDVVVGCVALVRHVSVRDLPIRTLTQ